MKTIYLLFFLVFTGSLQAQSLDFRILKSINKNDHRIWDKTMEGVSFSVNPLIPITVAGIWTKGYFNDDKIMMRNSYKSAISIGFAAILTASTKLIVNRSRPAQQYPNEIVQRTHSGKYSFPSGHTTSAFAMATSLTLSYQKWQVALPAYLYAGLVGYSRMRLGVHFPSDVLGGVVIGIGSGILVWQLDRLINNK